MMPLALCLLCMHKGQQEMSIKWDLARDFMLQVSNFLSTSTHQRKKANLYFWKCYRGSSLWSIGTVRFLFFFQLSIHIALIFYFAHFPNMVSPAYLKKNPSLASFLPVLKENITLGRMTVKLRFWCILGWKPCLLQYLIIFPGSLASATPIISRKSKRQSVWPDSTLKT